jgi:starch phosphorylase
VHGSVGPNNELWTSAVVAMRRIDNDAAGSDGDHVYEGSFTCERAGRYGFAVRVLADHPDLATPAELGLVAWGA